MTQNTRHTSTVLDLMDSIIAKADALQGDLLALSDLPVELGTEQSIATHAGKFAALVEHVSAWADSEAYVPGDGDWRDWDERAADGDAHTVTVPAATIEYFTHGPYPQAHDSSHDTTADALIASAVNAPGGGVGGGPAAGADPDPNATRALGTASSATTTPVAPAGPVGATGPDNRNFLTPHNRR